MKIPGVIVTEVAPVVAQFNVLLPPTPRPVGLAVKEFTTGKLAACSTVTVTFAVPTSPPAALMAVSV
ncbi:MAG TPA: hypothetical protein VI320_27080 [Terracidiphilus sp.]